MIVSTSRVARHLTAETHDWPAMTSLRLLAALNVEFNYARMVLETGGPAARALYWRPAHALRLATW